MFILVLFCFVVAVFSIMKHLKGAVLSVASVVTVISTVAALETTPFLSRAEASVVVFIAFVLTTTYWFQKHQKEK